jgi:hypothetical protein
MCAARYPAQNVFGAYDRQGKASDCSVQRTYKHQSTRFHHGARKFEEPAEIGDVLDHFHGENNVEVAPVAAKVSRAVFL